VSQENVPLDHDQDAAIPKNPADRKKLLISSAPRVPTHSAGPLFVGSTQGFTGGLCGPEENQANVPLQVAKRQDAMLQQDSGDAMLVKTMLVSYLFSLVESCI